MTATSQRRYDDLHKRVRRPSVPSSAKQLAHPIRRAAPSLSATLISRLMLNLRSTTSTLTFPTEASTTMATPRLSTVLHGTVGVYDPSRRLLGSADDAIGWHRRRVDTATTAGQMEDTYGAFESRCFCAAAARG